MSWSSFFTILVSLYLTYYALIIVMDLMKVSKASNGDDEILSFVDDYLPKKIGMNEFEDSEEPQIIDLPIPVMEENQENELKINTKERKEEYEREENVNETELAGGVSIKEFFNLAKNEAIVKTKSIAFHV